jgi:hypothetical protein
MTAPSTAARLARQSARLESAMTAAAAQLTSALPDLGTSDATVMLQAVVPGVRGPARYLEELAGHLAAHPAALTSGDTHCPLTLLRLIRVLHDAGHPVVRPGCARCGKAGADIRQWRPEGRVCGSCDKRSRKGACARCGATSATITAKRPEGGICDRCYRADPQVVEECSECGRVRCPVVRLPDGGSLCRSCWKRPVHACVSCGKTAAAALLDDTGAYCYRCYSRQRRPRRLCGRCGRLGPIARNASGGQPDLCNSCYRGPQMTCSRCGQTRPCQRVRTGEPICRTCYHRDERPRVTCARCQRDLPVVAHWPLGPVCEACYSAILRSPAECARCRACQPLIARGDDGAGVCGPCAGHDADYTCRQCGRTGNPYARGRCAHCVLAGRARDLLTRPDGTISPQLQPLAEAFAQISRPFTGIKWIATSPAARLLAYLAAEDRPLSHDLLDELPPTRSLHYIRQVMAQAGILPSRDEDLEQVPSWLEHRLAGTPAAHARLVRPFLHWHLLRRARNRASARRYPVSAGPDLRSQITVALELLAWADKQAITLQDLRQDDIDRWLDEQDTQRRNHVREFLNWTAARGLTRKLAVPLIPRQQPADLLGDDERWQLLQQCLTDEALPADVRAAGALILLFGLQAQRIRHLTADHVIQRDDSTYLTAGRHPVLLPPRLAAILIRLAAQPPPQLMIPHDPAAPRWLFPGRIPGQPVHGRSLTTRLNRHGITARPARNGALIALIALAADLPAAIMADLLGMHVTTAVRWVKYARRDWAAYLAIRAADQKDTETE